MPGPGRGDPGRHAPGGLPLPARATGSGCRVASSAWPVVWPSPYPATFELHRGPEHAVPTRPAGRAAGRRAGRRAGPGVQDDAAGRAARSAAKAARTRRSGGSRRRHRRTRVTVTIHDGGEDILEDGRRLYSAETLELTACDADPAHATPGRGRRLSLAGASPSTTEIRARSRQTSDARGVRPGRRARGRPRRRAVLPPGVAGNDRAALGLRPGETARGLAGDRPRASILPSAGGDPPRQVGDGQAGVGRVVAQQRVRVDGAFDDLPADRGCR